MKEKLIEVINMMQSIETHGNSTLLMADCIRQLAVIIDTIPDEDERKDNE